MNKFLKTFSKYDLKSGGFEPMFNSPFSPKGLQQLIGKISQREQSQAVAATSASDVFWTADFAGAVADLYVVNSVTPGSGESMVYDVQKSTDGGATFVSILTGTFTLNATTNVSKDQIDLYHLIDRTKMSFNVGDIFETIRTYTAGTPAMKYNKVVMEPSISAWK